MTRRAFSRLHRRVGRRRCGRRGGRQLSGPDIAEGEHEIVLNEERPVVDTEVVPKERVRLDRDVETVDESVSADVRKERVEVEDQSSEQRR